MQTEPRSKKTTPLNIALAYQGFVDEPVPSIIFDAIDSGKSKQILNISLIAIAFLLGMTISMLIGKFSSTAANSATVNLPTELLALGAHHTFTSDLVHPVQVNADDVSHLNSWLSYRVGKSISVTMLDTLDYKLIGANIIPDDATISTMTVYENQHKQRVSLVTRYSGGTQELSVATKSKSAREHILLWQRSGNQHALVSTIDSDQLLAIYDYIERL